MGVQSWPLSVKANKVQTDREHWYITVQCPKKDCKLRLAPKETVRFGDQSLRVTGP